MYSDDEVDDETADRRGSGHGPPDLWELSRPGVEPAKPGMTLDDLVEKILLLLSLEEVDEAVALHATWKNDADSDDHRQASTQVVARWALTRELLGVAPALPQRVVSVLAKSITSDDLASARGELDAYRRANLTAACDADHVLRTRTKDLHRPLAGALYVEPPPPTFTTYASPQSERSGAGVWWVLAMVVFAIIKVAARSYLSSILKARSSALSDFLIASRPRVASAK